MMQPVVDSTTAIMQPFGQSGGAVYGWVANANIYDIDGRSVKAWQATYVDGSTSNPLPLSVTVISAQSADGSQPATDDQITVNATASTSTPPTLTTYTPDGQTLTTTDQYGGVTTKTYDASGHLIETQYPDGTETISVYDTLGRVILATDKFVPGQSAPILATRTVYDSLGQTIATQRVSGVSITVSPDPSYGSLFAITAVTGAGLINSNQTDPAEGTWSLDLSGNWAVNAATPAYYSQSQTVYDAQGQAVETDSPSGLRTGTVYYADGSVEYTGPLNPTAPATWYLSANPTGSFMLDSATGRLEYTDNLYNLVDNKLADANQPWYGLTYNETIQNDGQSATGAPAADDTETFQDSSGRTIFVVYDDGSFTQTLYSIGDHAIGSGAPYLPSGYTPPSVTIPEGGSETINIAERRSGDPVEATIDMYDAAGNLVDVYEPPVVNGASGSTTPVIPHTHYDYDSSGDEVDQIDAKGNETFWTYDANGNELSRTLPDNTTSTPERETLTYNIDGQLATHIDFDGNTATYTYFSGYGNGAYAGSVEQIEYAPITGAPASDVPETVSVSDR